VEALQDLKRTAEAVISLLNALPLEARDALFVRLGGVPFRESARTLSELQLKRLRADPINRAMINLIQLCAVADMAMADVSAGNHPAPRGRPKKEEILGFIQVAATVYEKVTGKMPTRVTGTIGKKYGRPVSPFHEFVAVLFKIFGIRGSPDDQIRKLMGKKRAAESSIPH
jgi:hypothetical protein